MKEEVRTVSGAQGELLGTSGSVYRRVHLHFFCQVDAEEAGIGRGGITDGGRCTNAAAKTLQSLSSCSHIHHHLQHTGRRVHEAAHSLPAARARSRSPGNSGAVEESSSALFISAGPRGICHRHTFSFCTRAANGTGCQGMQHK